MRQKYKSSRYGLDSPLGFRTLHQIRESEKREKKTMSSEDRKKLIEDAKKSKP